MKTLLWICFPFCGGIAGVLAAPAYGIKVGAGFLGMAAIVGLFRVLLAPKSFARFD
jgi:hypothetical protein